MLSINAEWPHWQWVGPAYPRSVVRAEVAAIVLRFVARIYTVPDVELRELPMMMEDATSQLNLPSLTPLSIVMGN